MATEEVLQVVSLKGGPKERAVNICIYCNQCGETDEHVLAEAFNGKFILRKASCKNCQNITSAFEGKVAGPMFKDYRYFKNWGKKKRRKFDPIRSVKYINTEGQLRVGYFSIEDVGSCVFFPEFLEASLTDDSLGATHSNSTFSLEFGDKARLPVFISEIKREKPYHEDEFLKFLAKTAYCFAVLQFGSDGCLWYLKDAIINGFKTHNYKHIGTPKEHLFPENERGAAIFVQQNIVKVHIKFIAETNAVYEVIVGEIIDDTNTATGVRSIRT